MADPEREILFTIHFGGIFHWDEGYFKYAKGTEHALVLKWNEIKLQRMKEELRDVLEVGNLSLLYYCIPDTDLTKRKVLRCDNDIEGMKDVLGKLEDDIMDLYVEHDLDESEWNDFDPCYYSFGGDESVMEVSDGTEGTECTGPLRDCDDIEVNTEAGAYVHDEEELEKFREDNRQYRRKYGLEECSDDEYCFDSRSEGSYVTDSDEESIYRRVEHRYPKYRVRTVPTFEAGLTFDSAVEYRKACRYYGIMSGYVLQFPKNTKTAIRAICKANGCKFFVLASYETDIGKFQLINMNLDHSCQKVSKNPMASSSWTAQNFGVKKIRIQPDLKTRHFKEMVSDELGLNITREQAKKAKKMSIQLLKGDPVAEFPRMPAYVEELKRVMPGSTVVQDSLTTEDGVQRFWRIYVCFNAIKKGFKEGCRPLIGLDGCFIKTEYKGQLLAAVGRDGDNHMYPLAWAVVDKENNENWSWFV